MLLSTFAVLMAIGFVAWIVGEFFSYTGIAAIGATVVIIAGSGIALTGLQFRSGAVHNSTHTVIENDTVANSTTVKYQYQTTALADVLGVGILGSLGLGGVVMLLGAIMFSRSLSNEVPG